MAGDEVVDREAAPLKGTWIPAGGNGTITVIGLAG
jgi:hypothetical protein